MWAHSAVIAFVVEKTSTMVSRAQGRVRAASACPPHRSTTVLPSTVAANEAPTSRPASNEAANVSRTAANLGSHCPSIMGPRAHGSHAENLHHHPLLPPAVEFGVEHLLPGPQIERTPGDGQDHLVLDEGALQVRVRVVLAGLMVAVVPRGRELLEPLHHVVLETALLVVHPDARGDVHRRDEAEALLYPGRHDDLGHALGDVHQ